MNQQESTSAFLGRVRDIVNGTSATPAQILSLTKALLAYINKRFDAVSATLQSHKTESQKQHSDLSSLVSKLQNDVKGINTALKTKKGKVSFEQDVKDLWDQIKYLTEKMPTAFDDTQLLQQVAGLSRSVEVLGELVNKETEEDFVTRDEFDEELTTLRSSVASSKGGSKPANMPPPDFGPFHEAFTMDGATTEVTLSRGVGAQGNAVMVRYQGQSLDLGNQFTVSGNRITLLFSPADQTTISVTYWGG